jgi:hypothetical protein
MLVVVCRSDGGTINVTLRDALPRRAVQRGWYRYQSAKRVGSVSTATQLFGAADLAALMNSLLASGMNRAFLCIKRAS